MICLFGLNELFVFLLDLFISPPAFRSFIYFLFSDGFSCCDVDDVFEVCPDVIDLCLCDVVDFGVWFVCDDEGCEVMGESVSVLIPVCGWFDVPCLVWSRRSMERRRMFVMVMVCVEFDEDGMVVGDE